MSRQEDIEKRLEELPKGTLTYKTIQGKKQPYLQRTEKGKSISVYIKQGERERVLIEIEERRALEAELKLLKAYEERIADILKTNPYMINRPAIGYQDFETIISKGMLYIDKTYFVKEWWEGDDQISLITRPRRFGKSLMLSMLNCFFSLRYAGRTELFERLSVWTVPEYRELQGKWPVVLFSLAGLKPSTYSEAQYQLCQVLRDLFMNHAYILEEDALTDINRECYRQYLEGLTSGDSRYCVDAVNVLCRILYETYGKRVIVLLDEYDTPMLEAYAGGFWEDMARIMRQLFNHTFKDNKFIEKGIITGITRVTKESMFSDTNNMAIYSMTSDRYATCFGFTEEELFDCLECHDIEEKMAVKEWYDGFTIGEHKDIYNPWSILNYISNRQLLPYWVNTGGYDLMSRLYAQGGEDIKSDLEILLDGGIIHKDIDENLIFTELEQSDDAIWSLMLSAGYVKSDNTAKGIYTSCDLSITNKETRYAFVKMINGWFNKNLQRHGKFIKYLLSNDLQGMNHYMNEIAMASFSYFDVGGTETSRGSERFYHGFVLGLLVELEDEYELRSNRESGFGRYDVMLIPKAENLPAFVMEFKVRNEKSEETLEDTVANALKQIREKQYEAELISMGFGADNIVHYGFGFEGKTVLIGGEDDCAN